MLIDSHTHLNSVEFEGNIDHYLQLMHENNVSHALCVATMPSNIPKVISLAEKHMELYAAIGIHPDEELPDFVFSRDFLLQFASHPRVVAIGETGLDYYWHKGRAADYQLQRFEIHMEAAKIASLPLVIHCRDAAEDTWRMLKEGISDSGAVMHCFSENVEWARKFLDLGCYISLSGIVTFKNAVQMQEVAKFVPLDRLLVETDAPYLAPVPFRGKLNHPALVMHTAQFVADLRQMQFDSFAEALRNNFKRLFTRVDLQIGVYNP